MATIEKQQDWVTTLLEDQSNNRAVVVHRILTILESQIELLQQLMQVLAEDGISIKIDEPPAT